MPPKKTKAKVATPNDDKRNIVNLNTTDDVMTLMRMGHESHTVVNYIMDALFEKF
jgi:hypothetical protein